MKVKDERAFYFTASIMRDNMTVLRQGTLNAIDELAAIDRVYEMGRTVWKRTVLEVTILHPESGEVEATSKVGDAVKQHLLPAIKIEDNVEEKPEEKKSGFVPWGERPGNFSVGSIGTYFAPETFARLTGFVK